MLELAVATAALWPTTALSQTLQINPGDGAFIDANDYMLLEISVVGLSPAQSISSLYGTIDGVECHQDFIQCIGGQSVLTSGQTTFGCYFHASYLGQGTRIKNLDVQLSDGTVVSNTVVWYVGEVGGCQPSPEVCDGVDNDCNGVVDENTAADATNWFADSDGDGYGDPAVSATACSAPPGFVASSVDCDDTDAAISPAATEICDLVDNDCTGGVDQGIANCFNGQLVPPDPATIAPPLDPTAFTPMLDRVRFLFEGTPPIQTGVSISSFSPSRIAVVRGRVVDRSGAPAPGVTITVRDAPEFGSTITRADGWYDLVVNGGGVRTVVFTAQGYAPIQRRVRPPMGDFVVLEDVVVTPQDGASTISLSAGAPDQLAISTPSSDGDGIRQARILFPAGVSASAVLPDGTTTALSQLDVRITEYTVGTSGPAAMPGPLPATSSYTYAFDIAVDQATALGAEQVVLSQAVPYYVDNFLNFPAGEPVPVGFFDESSGFWIPNPSGVVIDVLGVDSAGAAIIDSDGDGLADVPARLNELGISSSELVAIASQFSGGQSLWRALLGHFSTYDFNLFAQIPSDAITPGALASFFEAVDDFCKIDGCVLQIQDQTAGVDASLQGLPFGLHYRTDRAPGNRNRSTVAIDLGPQVPASVTEIRSRVSIQGRAFEQTFAPSPDQTFDFVWDGMDAYGRETQGLQSATIDVGYAYQGVYEGTTRFGDNGSGFAITGDRARNELVTHSFLSASLGAFRPDSAGLGGWTLGIHHAFAPHSNELYRGDGDVVRVDRLTTNVNYIVASQFPNDRTEIRSPSDVTVDSDGNAYFIEAVWGPWSAGRQPFRGLIVRRVAPGGVPITYAGIEATGPRAPDGSVATQVAIFPTRITWTPNGLLFTEGNSIRRVDPDGTLSTIAGATACGPSPDGTTAAAAQLCNPVFVDEGPDGSIYFTEGYMLRRIDPSGVLSTVAGRANSAGVSCPPFGNPPAPLPATSVFAIPDDFTIADDGEIFYANSSCHQVYRVDRSGLLHLVAGTGTPGFSGDGSPAVNAQLTYPTAIARSANGDLYIGDNGNARVRRVGLDGVIQTFAGDGTAGVSQGGEPVLQMPLTASELGAGPDGSVFYRAGLGGPPVVGRIAPLVSQIALTDLAVASRSGDEIYVFDESGRHLSTYDASTQSRRWGFTYNAAGELTSIDDAFSNAITIERDTAGRPVAIRNIFGVRNIFGLTSSGRLSSVADEAGNQYGFQYDSEGLLTQIVDRRNVPDNFGYDATGRLIENLNGISGGWQFSRARTGPRQETVTITSATGRQTTLDIARDSSGARQEILTTADGLIRQRTRSPDGVVTTAHADGMMVAVEEQPDARFGAGRPIPRRVLVQLPSGLTSSAERTQQLTSSTPGNPLGATQLVETVTIDPGAPGQRQYHFTNDFATRTETALTPSGRSEVVRRNAQGLVTNVARSGLAAVTYAYNSAGQIASAGAGASARQSTFSYDTSGRVAQISGPLGWTQSMTYDAAGRVASTVLPGARTQSYVYDGEGNVTSFTTAIGTTFDFVYDAQGRLTRSDVPLVGGVAAPTTFTYDLEDRLTGVTMPDGTSRSLIYDGAGRLASTTGPSGTVTLTYDPATGNLARANGLGADMTFAHDGPVLVQTDWVAPITGSLVETFDTSLRVATQQIGSDVISFGYDADSLMVQAGELVLTPNPTSGLVASTTLRQVTTAHVFNEHGEPTLREASFGTTLLFSQDLQRDALGRVTRSTETVQGVTRVLDYEYNAAGELVVVREGGVATHTYGYDANGNLTTSTAPAGTVTASYDSRDRLVARGGSTFVYAPNGELVSATDSSGTTNYGYDDGGALTQVTLPNGTVVAYELDARGRRALRRVNGVVTHRWIHDESDRLVAAVDASGAVSARYVYGDLPHSPAYITQGTTAYRVISDQLGTPRLVVDATTGAVVHSQEVDAYGVTTSLAQSIDFPFGYAGGQIDPLTGLLHFGARDYDPRTTRWLQVDPAGRLLAPNGYGYSNSDPINFVDVDGQFAVTGALLAAIALSVAAEVAIQYLVDGKANWCGLVLAAAAPIASVRIAGLLNRGLVSLINRAPAIRRSGNALRVGLAKGGRNFRVSLGPHKKYWANLDGWRKTVGSFHLHLETKGAYLNFNPTGLNLTVARSSDIGLLPSLYEGGSYLNQTWEDWAEHN
ncbi:MAG: RHS repeat-associated core domain-containing protein [Deltaproteobacteria bacterium]